MIRSCVTVKKSVKITMSHIVWVSTGYGCGQILTKSLWSKIIPDFTEKIKLVNFLRGGKVCNPDSVYKLCELQLRVNPAIVLKQSF